MALIQSTAIPSGATDYEIDQSLRFNNPDNPYLSRTFGTPTNRKIWTFSAWVKRSFNPDYPRIISTATGNDNINFMNDDTLRFQSDFGYLVTTMKFRDASAFYHIMYAFDSTQSTEANRLKLYVNGTQVTDFGTSDYPTLNDEVDFNSAIVHDIGRNAPEALEYMDGYLAELNWIDGQAKAPADFGETGTYGEWKPIEYSGTYGNNGFYLPFKQDYTVEGFSTVIYKGSGASHYIGGTGFKPNLTWIKSRNHGYGHHLQDSLRGTGEDLYSNLTDAEYSNANSLQAFNTDGFRLGSDNGVNNSSKNYVAWNWDMGADTPTGFGCVTWHGNSTAGHSIGGVGFQPDLIISKRRSGADNGMLFDSVRGENARLIPNLKDAEATSTTILEAFEPDGFRVGTDGYMNYASGHNYVAWCWNMGGTTATNTSGSISSQVRANTTYGQSIVSYTGTGANATVGHGLSSSPELVIYKNRDDNGSSGATNGNWIVQSSAIGADDFLLLNDNSPEATDSGYFNGTRPSSSVLTLGAYNSNNGSSDDMVAYCFHSVANYSKISSYSGSGSSNAITTGFRPSWVMIKCTTSSESWYIFDSTRNPLNPVNLGLYADANNAEEDMSGGNNRNIQFDANGFTVLGTDSSVNSSGNTYIYMAFAGGMDSISDYNTDGSIDSRVKANTTYGQSIVSYNGNGTNNSTIGHGLSSAPEMVITKRRNNGTDYWAVYHASVGQGYLSLNRTDTYNSGNDRWGTNAPTSSLMNLGYAGGTNASGGTYISYCFHSVTGYSKIGSWVGNANDTAPVITTGFAPAFVMYKKATGVANWIIVDNTRNPSGIKNKVLYPDSSAVEYSSPDAGQALIFTSTGFQPGGAGGDMNGNNETYIYMAFADKREYAYWLDQSGNNNDWTSNNLTESDISVDSPTNNFCTWNPLQYGWNYTPVYTEGNTKISFTNAGAYGHGYGTIGGLKSGKWYWETLVNAQGTDTRIGIASQVTGSDGEADVWRQYIDNLNDGNGKNKNGGFDNSYGSSFTSGDIIGLAVDIDNGTIAFYNNNSSQGTAYTDILSAMPDDGWMPHSSGYNTSTITTNFGQDSSFAGNKVAQGNQDGNDIGDFYYTPPTGFLALCSKNLPDVAVVPSEHFNTVLYTGNQGTNLSITGVGFEPSLVWGKNRSSDSNHWLFDAVRGTTKMLSSDGTGAEETQSGVTAFGSDGFTLGTWIGSTKTNDSYVAWNWKANGSGSANTNGSINSTVSANTDAGFSIINWTKEGSSGTKTVGHGLSKSPEIIFFKEVDDPSHWSTYVGVGGSTTRGLLYLNLTAAQTTNDANQWSDTAPTSTVFTYNQQYTFGNNNTAEMIGYAFHSVDGYSKVGSYTGNGNADGTFVYTGFRPAFIMWKRYDAADDWIIIDNKRDVDNGATQDLRANLSGAEQTAARFDMVSNGFKWRATWNDSNTSGGTYIYIAFAETPFKYSNGR